MRKRHVILLALLGLPMVWTAPGLAETTFKASISASEEYNDNVNDTSKPRADFITAVSPNLTYDYQSNRVKAAIAYQGDFRKYAYGQRQDEILTTLNASASVVAVENLLVVDASDSNQMVFANAAQGTPTAADSTRTQVNQNSASAQVTLTPRINDRTQAKIGYRTSATLYGNDSGVNKNNQQVFADISHQLTPSIETGANVTADRQTSVKGDLTRFNATAVINYTYGDGCYVFARGGAVDTHYDMGTNTVLPTWSAGLTHSLGKTTLNLASSGDYADNPSSIYNSFRSTYSASVSHEFTRSRVTANVSYSDYSGQGTQSSQMLSTNVSLSYDLTPRLGLTLSGSQDFNGTNLNSPNRMYGTAELNYELPKDFAVRFYYRHKASFSSSQSPNPFNANSGLGTSSSPNTNAYSTNIVGVSLSKSF